MSLLFRTRTLSRRNFFLFLTISYLRHCKSAIITMSIKCKSFNDGKRILAAETVFRSYQGSREIDESVICFDTPVNFTAIKILSSSMHVSTLQGGFMLGVTEPTHFPVQFLCNNIHGSSISELWEMGTMDYDEDLRIKFMCRTNIWSDKLVMKGRFSAITVVVYGSPKDSEIQTVQKKDRNCNMPPMPLLNGVPNIMDLANNYDLDSNITDELSNFHLDSD